MVLPHPPVPMLVRALFFAQARNTAHTANLNHNIKVAPAEGAALTSGPTSRTGDTMHVVDQDSLSEGTFRCFSFNINRIADRSKLVAFIKVLERDDAHLAAVQETWLRGEPPSWVDSVLAGTEYVMVFHNRVVGERGGGVAFLCHRRLKFSVLKMVDDGILWILLDRGHTMKLAVASVYIPPASSPYCTKLLRDRFNCLRHDLLKFKPVYDVILLGDFNAAIGCTPALLNSLGQVQHSIQRGCCSSKMNLHGRKLCELAEAFELVIVNGLHIPGVEPPKPTTVLGHDVLDYAVVDTRLLPLLQTFLVDEEDVSFLHSDHLPIVATFSKFFNALPTSTHHDFRICCDSSRFPFPPPHPSSPIWNRYKATTGDLFRVLRLPKVEELPSDPVKVISLLNHCSTQFLDVLATAVTYTGLERTSRHRQFHRVFDFVDDKQLFDLCNQKYLVWLRIRAMTCLLVSWPEISQISLFFQLRRTYNSIKRQVRKRVHTVRAERARRFIADMEADRKYMASSFWRTAFNLGTKVQKNTRADFAQVVVQKPLTSCVDAIFGSQPGVAEYEGLPVAAAVVPMPPRLNIVTAGAPGVTVSRNLRSRHHNIFRLSVIIINALIASEQTPLCWMGPSRGTKCHMQ